MTITTTPEAVPDETLAEAVTDGNKLAALELFSRYGKHVWYLAAKYGNFVAFDREDVTQEAFASLYVAAAESTHSPRTFDEIYRARSSNDVREEATRQRFPIPMPFKTFQRVYQAMAAHSFDATAARDYLADAAPAGERVTRETFDAVWLVAFGVHLDWGSPVGNSTVALADVVSDPRPADHFATIENRDAVARLLDMLTPVEREVIERTYGLAEFEPEASPVIGTVMGMHAESIRRIHSRVIAKLQIHAEDPHAH